MEVVGDVSGEPVGKKLVAAREDRVTSDDRAKAYVKCSVRWSEYLVGLRGRSQKFESEGGQRGGDGVTLKSGGRKCLKLQRK